MNAQKKQVTQEQFQKEVEVEFSYLVHWNRLNKRDAQEFALKNVQEKFEVIS